MKKVVMIICTIAFLFFSKNVYAKDTFKSINKYEEESLNYIYKIRFRWKSSRRKINVSTIKY